MKLRLARWGMLLVLMLAGCGSTHAHPADPHPEIDVLHYTFRLTLADDTDRIAGEATVDLQLRTDTLTALRLDLVGPNGSTGMRVEQVMRDGAPVDFSQSGDHLHIALDEAAATGDRHRYTITYAGVPADGFIIGENRHGARTFFGDNWPNRARHWLPTVDHPSDKATVEFVVTAPTRYEVVANGEHVATTALDDGQRRWHWRSTAPLPTKVTVIGAADFAIDTVGAYDGTPIESWVYPPDTTAGFREFARATRILRFFESRLGDYPYVKLANVQSTTRYGGMENASAIFYSEQAVGDDRNDEPLLAHEIAHQWFGNAATEADWPHLWLSEGFATYLTQLYLEDTYGPERRREGMRQARQQVARFAEQAPDRPLVDTLAADPNTLLNPNSYQKGAWVLHMLRREVGDSTFWAGLRDYYAAYRDANASTDDFRRVMEEAADRELGWFFRQWTRRPGQPHVEGTWRYDTEAGALIVSLRQTQDAPPFRFSLDVGIYEGNGEATPRVETIEVQERTHTATFSLDAPPDDVRLDPHAWTLMTVSFRGE